jgi:beta-hydroxyacyl-ACP dehydratase FabZ
MKNDPVADWAEILDTLPHRYPFLLVDRITLVEENKRIEGYKNVSFNEPFFQGHFPGEPVMPGVLIVEAMAQVGAMLLKRVVPDYKRKLIMFLGMDDVRFRKPVRPGDRLDFVVEITRPSLKAARLQGVATVDGEEAARATLLATVVERIIQEEQR